MFSSKYQQLLKNSKKRFRHQNYLANIEKLLEKAVYVNLKENTKPDKKADVLKYHYFKVGVKIGDHAWLLVIDCEEKKSEDRKSTRLNSSHIQKASMPSSA